MINPPVFCTAASELAGTWSSVIASTCLAPQIAAFSLYPHCSLQWKTVHCHKLRGQWCAGVGHAGASWSPPEPMLCWTKALVPSRRRLGNAL
jgi:hypothetical protein